MNKVNMNDKLEIKTAFQERETIPLEYTGYGKNISPEFKIQNLSANTMKKKLLKTMKGHILQKGSITGSFKK